MLLVSLVEAAETEWIVLLLLTTLIGLPFLTPIIFATNLRIGQHFERFSDGLELLSRSLLLVLRVLIRMPQDGQLTVGLLDDPVVGIPRHAELLIEVLLLRLLQLELSLVQTLLSG